MRTATVPIKLNTDAVLVLRYRHVALASDAIVDKPITATPVVAVLVEFVLILLAYSCFYFTYDKYSKLG